MHDRRSGFVFRTNPNGAMWDAQFTGVDDADENWNGIWDVAVARDVLGWTAEFRIPFRTLRFRAGGGAFGFNVQRFIRRKNETVLWRGWGRSEGFYRLIYEGELQGLGELRRTGDLELKPYVLGRATATEHDALDRGLGGGGVSGEAGLDAKVAVSSTVNADFTVNTDFAQVEVDQQVINLIRFPTFLPEKRGFFLESDSLFDFATPSRAQPFYSRRIGLAADGEPVPILGGVRLYGKAGPWTLGLLDAQTGHGDRSNYLVVRAKHDLFDRSYIGAIGVQRVPVDGGGAERVAGLDIDLPLVVGGRNLEPSFWIMGSQSPGSGEYRSPGGTAPTFPTTSSTTSSRSTASTVGSTRRSVLCGVPASGRPPGTSTSRRGPVSSGSASSTLSSRSPPGTSSPTSRARCFGRGTGRRRTSSGSRLVGSFSRGRIFR